MAKPVVQIDSELAERLGVSGGDVVPVVIKGNTVKATISLGAPPAAPPAPSAPAAAATISVEVEEGGA